ncbi:MAG: uncharacterized protein H6R26_2064, partial [Proteobacteria bacterium]|nr:uncharacterized protein [Pseudomonadota bacterium]
KDDFAREREQILVSAEADKRSMLQESHEQIVRETNRAHARANLKLGAALAGLLGIGGLLLAIEFVSIGLMTLTAAGGMLAGYVMRARQDALRQREKMLPSLAPPAVDFLATEEQKTLPPAPGR